MIQVSFYSIDTTDDMESFYDCYFESNEEEADAYKICHLLNDSLKKNVWVKYQVNIVDEHLEYIRKIEI